MIEVSVHTRLGRFDLGAEFSSESGGVTAIFGRSGSGKTSLINAIAGLLRPARGRIAIGDTVLFDSKAGINLPVRDRRLGYVFQDGRLFPHMTVRRNLTYGERPGKASLELGEVVELLGIRHLLTRHPHNLSGGERQRVAIGRALLSSPRVLLMDEPLASLDSPRRDEILPYLARLREMLDIAIIYVGHDMDEVVRLSDTLVLLSEGKVAAVGPVEEITSRLDLHPLTGRYEAGSVLTTRVAEQDEEFGLTHLALKQGELLAPKIDLPKGSPVRVRVRARDVAVARVAPTKTSFSNALPATLAEIGDNGGPYVDLRLKLAGGEDLRALVTRRAFVDMELEPGAEIIALIKSTAIGRRSFGM
ncbi:MAG: molybdenum ABC transporter ATP-binding protein [Rhodospirillaceae bacterium]|jgi:molybdate transport system ATP-binding protein|nr:molybdenum ABC transporter ATP-binding protein [Rhodospirillaceae bacterium]